MNSIYKLGPERKKETSRKALQNIIYIIAGIAIAELVTSLFLEGGFVVFEVPELFLGISFLCIIIRLVHSRTIHLEITYGMRYKLTLDTLFTLVEVLFLYLAAFSIKIWSSFNWNLVVITIVDGIWLVLLFVGLKIHNKKLIVRKVLHFEVTWGIIDILLLDVLSNLLFN